MDFTLSLDPSNYLTQMREFHWTSLWLFFKLYFFIIWTPCNSATSTTEPWIPHGRNVHSFAVVLFCCLIFTWFIFMKIIKQAFLKTLEWFCVVSRTSSPAIPHGFYTDPRHQHGRCLHLESRKALWHQLAPGADIDFVHLIKARKFPERKSTRLLCTFVQQI